MDTNKGQILRLRIMETTIKQQNIFGATRVAAVLLLVLLLSACAERPKPFTLVLLPDTQVYSHSYPEIFRAQTEWIVEEADRITFVLHQGDITDHNSDEE